MFAGSQRDAFKKWKSIVFDGKRMAGGGPAAEQDFKRSNDFEEMAKTEARLFSDERAEVPKFYIEEHFEFREN